MSTRFGLRLHRSAVHSTPGPKRSTGRDSRRRGAVLIVVMWVLVILGMLLLGLNRQVQASSARSQAQLDAVRAHWLARAGVERALAVLADDVSNYDSQTDLWYDDPFSFDDVELADGFVVRVVSPPQEGSPDDGPRFGLDDEASRMNLNTADRALLSGMTDVRPEQVDALIDWVDGNEEAEPGGAERGYYQRLSFPYEIRNGPMRTHREALLVKGIDRAEFFAEDVDTDGLLDRRENDGDETWPPDSPDGRLERGLAGISTVYSYELNKTLSGEDRVNVKETDADTLTSRLGITRALADRIVEQAGQLNSVFDLVGVRGEGGQEEDEDSTNEVTLEWLAEHFEELTLESDQRLMGRVNVNTAGREVLEAVPGIDAKTADSILNQRSTSGSFLSVGDLLKTKALTEDQFREAANFLTVRSNVLRVRSIGRTPSGVSRSIVAVVDRGGASPTILYWWQSE